MISDALAGALVGSFGTAIAGYVLHTGQRISRMKSLSLGIATELETLWSQHQKNCGLYLMTTPAQGYFTATYPLSSDYFTTYTANAADLGELRDAELRSRIVKTYVALKGFIDSFRYYNDLLSAAPRFQSPAPGVPGAIIQGAYTTSLVDYTLKLKSGNQDLDSEIPRLVHDLRDYADLP